MKFYRVKEICDGIRKPNRNGEYVGGELYTEREVKNQNLDTDFMDEIQLPKSRTYYFFGVRFSLDD